MRSVPILSAALQIGAVLALVAGVACLTSIALAKDWEVAGLGAIVGVFLWPCVVCCLVARWKYWSPRRCVIAFTVPAALLVMLIAWFLPAASEVSDGGRQMGLFVVQVMVVTGLLVSPILAFVCQR